MTSVDQPYEVDWSSAARRALQRIPEKVAFAAIEFIYGPLAENPNRVGRALKLELEGLHRARRGDHRILYRIHENEHSVLIVAIEHRSDVYRTRG